MRAGSSPARHAAVPTVSAAAAPAVTSPASAPVCRAITALAAAWSSAISTKLPAASVIASRTSSGIRLPPRRVSNPAALIRVRTPNRS